MIGLDTNVLVRYITQDDPIQASKATALVEKELTAWEPGFITLVTLVELAWVLAACYGQKKPMLLAVLEQIISTKQFQVEQADCAYQAVKRFANCKADFSDVLINVLSEQAGCEHTVTFDKKAVSAGMRLL